MLESGCRALLDIQTPRIMDKLLGLAVQRMFAATRAVLVKFQTPRIIPAVFFRGVVALLAIRALQMDCGADIFLRGHSISPTSAS